MITDNVKLNPLERGDGEKAKESLGKSLRSEKGQFAEKYEKKDEPFNWGHLRRSLLAESEKSNSP